jgi:hypothetical protein
MSYFQRHLRSETVAKHTGGAFAAPIDLTILSAHRDRTEVGLIASPMHGGMAWHAARIAEAVAGLAAMGIEARLAGTTPGCATHDPSVEGPNEQTKGGDDA